MALNEVYDTGYINSPERSMDDNAFRAQRARELDVLRNEITELAGHLNAANYRFLKLIAEFDRREGWVDNETCPCGGAAQ
jgi:hypothetical protein